MSVESYEEQILKAVEIIADKKVSDLSFDKTITGAIETVILDSNNVNTGEYKVKYQDSILTAYVPLNDQLYVVGDLVSVKIPLGDFSNRNIITGYANKVNTSLALDIANSKATVYKSEAELTRSIDDSIAILTGGEYFNGTNINQGDMWIVTNFPYLTGDGWKTYTWTGSSWSTPDSRRSVDGGIITANSLHARSIVSESISTEQLSVRAKNLVNNFSVQGYAPNTFPTDGSWAESVPGTAKIYRVAYSPFSGAAAQTVDSMRIAVANQNNQVLSDYFEVDPHKSYKFSMSVKSGNLSSKYLGFYCYDSNKNLLGVYRFDVASRTLDPALNTNPYFAYWTKSTTPSSTWVNCEGYVMATGTPVAAFPSGQNVSSNFMLHPNAKYMQFRFLHYNTTPEYGSGTTSYASFYSPSVTVIDGGLIVADQIQAGRISAAVEMTSPIIRSSKDNIDSTSTGFWLSSTGLNIGTSTNYLKYKVGANPALSVVGGAISGGTVTGSTITGGVLQTALPGANRVVISGQDADEIFGFGYIDFHTAYGALSHISVARPARIGAYIDTLGPGSSLGSLYISSPQYDGSPVSSIGLYTYRDDDSSENSCEAIIQAKSVSLSLTGASTMNNVIAAYDSNGHTTLSLSAFDGGSGPWGGAKLKGLKSGQVLQVRALDDLSYADVHARTLYGITSLRTDDVLQMKETRGSGTALRDLYLWTDGTTWQLRFYVGAVLKKLTFTN